MVIAPRSCHLTQAAPISVIFCSFLSWTCREGLVCFGSSKFAGVLRLLQAAHTYLGGGESEWEKKAVSVASWSRDVLRFNPFLLVGKHLSNFCLLEGNQTSAEMLVLVSLGFTAFLPVCITHAFSFPRHVYTDTGWAWDSF